jgi:hypothetical protein
VSIARGNQTIALAALAILGHKSAHSFPMGPVMAEPEQKECQKLLLFIIGLSQDAS